MNGVKINDKNLNYSFIIKNERHQDSTYLYLSNLSKLRNNAGYNTIMGYNDRYSY